MGRFRFRIFAAWLAMAGLLAQLLAATAQAGLTQPGLSAPAWIIDPATGEGLPLVLCADAEAFRTGAGEPVGDDPAAPDHHAALCILCLAPSTAATVDPPVPVYRPVTAASVVWPGIAAGALRPVSPGGPYPRGPPAFV